MVKLKLVVKYAFIYCSKCPYKPYFILYLDNIIFVCICLTLFRAYKTIIITN